MTRLQQFFYFLKVSGHDLGWKLNIIELMFKISYQRISNGHQNVSASREIKEKYKSQNSLVCLYNRARAIVCLYMYTECWVENIPGLKQNRQTLETVNLYI